MNEAMEKDNNQKLEYCISNYFTRNYGNWIAIMGIGSLEMLLHYKEQEVIRGEKIRTKVTVIKDKEGNIKNSKLIVQVGDDLTITKKYRNKRILDVYQEDFFGDGINEILVVVKDKEESTFVEAHVVVKDKEESTFVEAQIFDIQVRQQSLDEVFTVKKRDACLEIVPWSIELPTGEKRVGIKVLLEEEKNEPKEMILFWSKENLEWEEFQ